VDQSTLKCDLCHYNPSHRTITLEGHAFALCAWCEFRAWQWFCGNNNHSIINIYWGAGRLGWADWYSLRTFLRKYGIKELLEFGIGLSTELFVNEGIFVTGFDVLPEHVHMYQNHDALKGLALFHHYSDDGPPPVEQLYPKRRWEFVFVDGPQERTAETQAAMEVSSRFVFLHDRGYGDADIATNPDWIPIAGSPREAKLFVRRDKA